MKKLLALLPVALLVTFAFNVPHLSKKDKKYARNYLEDTRSELLNTIAGLTQAQLNFKSAPDKWSINNCIHHIAIVEKNLWQMCEAAINAGPNPGKRSEIKATDEEMVKFMTDRTKKFNAPEAFRPENSPFSSTSDALNSFKASRDKLIKFVKNTKIDLRNHVATIPGGMADAYQLILLIGAHSNRHTQQIAEVKADPNFPK